MGSRVCRRVCTSHGAHGHRPPAPHSVTAKQLENGCGLQSRGIGGGPADLHFRVPAEPGSTQTPASQMTLGRQAWDQDRSGCPGDGERAESGPAGWPGSLGLDRGRS